MSLDLTTLVGLTAPDDFAANLPQITGLTGVQSMLAEFAATPQFDLMEAVGLSDFASGFAASIMPSSLFEGMFDGIGKSAVGSILDQIGEQTKLADFATAGLLSGITPILEGVAQAQAAQFAPILDAIKGTYFEGFTSTAVTGILASSRDAGLAGFSSGELPAIRSLARDWEGLGLLDFATPVAKPEARKTAEVPTSPEVERYETLSAAESLGIAALQRVEELITGLQVMLHADARNLEKRYAVDDRERRVERRLLVLAIVLPSAIALIQLLKG